MRAAPIRRETQARSAPVAPAWTTPLRPYRARRPSGYLVRAFRQPGPDHAVAGDEPGKALFAPALRTGGAHRQHEISNFRGRIPDANVGAFRQVKTEIAEHAARILHRLGAIGRGLVPDRRQSKHRPRITGAKRTHDHVVKARGVLECHDVFALTPDIAEFGNCRRGIPDEAGAKSGIAPSSRHHARAVARPDLGLIGFD